MTIEFKCVGDVMVFECDAFRIQVFEGSHSIKLSDAVFRSGTQAVGILGNAFKVLDMMLEHKARQTRVLKIELDIEDAVNKDPLKRFREFMKREGL